MNDDDLVVLAGLDEDLYSYIEEATEGAVDDEGVTSVQPSDDPGEARRWLLEQEEKQRQQDAQDLSQGRDLPDDEDDLYTEVEQVYGWEQPPGPDDEPPDATPKTTDPGDATGPATVTYAVKPNPAHWVKVREGWAYRIHTGATLCGISATYLRSCARWPEIWAIQSAKLKSTYTPTSLPVGTLVLMPPEAVQRARELGVLPAAKVGAGALPWVVGGVILVGVGAGIYYATRK